jgi:capsid portal protein
MLSVQAAAEKVGYDDILPVVKAHFIEAEPATKSAQVPVEDADGIFGKYNAVPPLYDPLVLAKLADHSSALRPCIDAYCTNLESHGYRMEPVAHIDSKEMTAEIAQHLEKEFKREPTPLELEIKRKEIRAEMEKEERLARNFFRYACGKDKFVLFRMKLRRDLEVMGNAYIEVIRNARGEIARFERIPAQTVRLMQPEFVDVEVEHRYSLFECETVLENREFRKCLQVVQEKTVFFKDFGDPRLISRKKGKVYGKQCGSRECKEHKAIQEAMEVQDRRPCPCSLNLMQMLTDDPTDAPAKEIIHLKIDSPRTPYGVPRWIGVFLEVVGTRLASEVNMLYFENKSIPPLAILVSGGKFTGNTVDRIKDYISNSLKGSKNFHKILVLEAEGGTEGRIENTERFANTGRVKIELKPLTDAMQKDGLFLNYTERNLDIVGMAFRLPKLLRGDIRDFNRGTADAALNFTEQQVFQPLRNEFDHKINDVLAAMGVKYWEFVSNAPIVRDPVQMADIIYKLMSAGALIPREGRVLAGDVFNKQFPELTADWTHQPLILTQQQHPVQREDGLKGTDTLNEQIGAGIRGPADFGQPSPLAQTFGAESGGSTMQSEGPEVVQVPAEQWYHFEIAALDNATQADEPDEDDDDEA